MLKIAEIQEARRPGVIKPLKCPHCGQGFALNLALVVASRNCPGCGEQVVAEPDDKDHTPPFTIEQLDAAKETYDRTMRRVCWAALITLLPWFAVIVVTSLYRDTIRDAVRPFIDPGWLVVPLIFLPIIGGMAAVLLIVRRAERTLRCPHCAAACAGQFGCQTHLTGNCWQCGRQLAELPEEAAGPLPTIGEFKESVARHTRVELVGSCLMSGLLLTYFIAVATNIPRNSRWQELEDRYGAMGAAIDFSVQTAVVLFAWSLVLLPLVRLLFRWLRHRREAEPLLSCPQCRTALLPSFRVIASRRCPGCHRLVLADPKPSPDVVAPKV